MGTEGDGSDVREMEGDVGAEAMFRATWPWALGALVASAGLGSALMHALKNHSRTVVWGVMYAKVGILAFVSLSLLARGVVDGGLVCAFVAAIAAFVIYLWRGELNLVASMIAVSAQSLEDNPHLMTVTFALQLGVVAYVLPVAWMAVKASQHGAAAINQYATDKASGSNACVGFYGQPVDCCTWNMDSWVGSYYALVALAAVWVIAAALECRMYVVGGVVSQWYFAPAGTRDFKGTTKTSLRNAFGPSFGTICYGGFVITIIEMLKQATEKARRENNRNIIMCCVAMCLECIYAIIEYISRFAMIQASMTGEAFCDAARSITDLLQRNFLLAYGTYAFPQSILGFMVVILSGLFGYIVYLLSDLGLGALTSANDTSTVSFFGGIVCFVVSYIVLTFLVTVLLNVVDAVFVCYAIDKDRSTVHHADLHAVFNEVTEKQNAAMGEPLDNTQTKYASM